MPSGASGPGGQSISCSLKAKLAKNADGSHLALRSAVSVWLRSAQCPDLRALWRLFVGLGGGGESRVAIHRHTGGWWWLLIDQLEERGLGCSEKQRYCPALAGTGKGKTGT